MLLSSLLSLAASGLTANAFLVPLEIANAEVSNEFANAGPAAINSKSTTINLDCSNCPYAIASIRDGAHEWTSKVKSDLVMDFTAQDKALKLNGRPFYFANGPMTPPNALFAKQMKKDDEVTSFGASDRALTLSYSLEFDAEKQFPNIDGQTETLISATMTILGLDEQMVSIENIHITAIRGSDGELSLLSILTSAPDPNAPDAKCTSIMCRVFTKIINKVHSASHKVKTLCMHCLHRLHAGATSSPTEHLMGKPNHKTNHHGGHHGGHHGHRGFVHKVAHGIKRAFSFVILPVIVGVAFGTVASAIGMLVGQVVMFLWLRWRRGANSEQGGYERVEGEDKDGLPKYEELEGQEIVSEKV